MVASTESQLATTSSAQNRLNDSLAPAIATNAHVNGNADTNGKTQPTALMMITTGTKPQSFSISQLHASDFNVQHFIADRRQYAPLSLVRDELRTYVSHLSSQIVQALQKDFNLFTNFGPSLSDATQLAKVLSPALVKLNAQLDHLHTHLQSQANTLNDALLKRHEIHNRRVSLQTLVAVHDSLVKCERLLRQYSPLSNEPLAHDALALLDRITAETAQLSFTLTRAHPCAFLEALSSRLSTVKRQVRASLDQCLQRAMPSSKPFDPDLLTRVLALYVVAGMQDDAHDFFTRQIVAPFASQRLRMGVMLAVAERRAKQDSNSANSSISPGDALRVAHDEIVNFLGDHVLPLISLCQSDSRLAKRLDFVGQSVWPHIQRAISTHMAASFSPGIPDVFHRSFKAGSDIFAAVEAAASDEFRAALRESKTTIEFWRHWNLPVYFQLRFQEISSAFESRLADGPISINDVNQAVDLPDSDRNTATMDARLLRTDVYKSAATAALVACLRRCWSDHVFVVALTHRFVRLSLQLIARYATWVRTGLAGEWASCSQNTNSSTNNVNDSKNISASMATKPAASNTSTSSGKEGMERGAARIVHDVGVLQTRLPAELASVLRARCPSLGMETVEAIESGFADAVERLGGLVPDVVQTISDTLAQSCTENLQPLRGIIATYRMSSKQAPSRHSSFVPKILRPLRAFLKEYESIIDDAIGKTIATKVVDKTGHEYFIMATELVEKNKSSEATLRRLNIGRSGNAAAQSRTTGGMSVVEKIATQLFLDVEQFADEVTAFGIDVTTIESVQKLRQDVKRERQVARGEQPTEKEDAQAPSIENDPVKK